MTKIGRALNAGKYREALELLIPKCEAGDADSWHTAGHLLYLSRHRFQQVNETQSWDDLTAEDFDAWDAQDSADSLHWFRKAFNYDRQRENMSWLKEVSDCPNIRMHEIVYSSPLTGLNRALIKATLANDETSVCELLNHGADVEAKTKNGFSCLIWACSHSRLGKEEGGPEFKVIELLVNRGASVNARTNYGTTPLEYVSQLGNFRAVKFLISKGAEVNDSEEEGSSALYVAALQGHLKTTAFLIEHGAQINGKAHLGKTPLMAAADTGFLPIAELLLEKGADPDVRDDDGKTALDHAKSERLYVDPEQKSAVVSLLEKHKKLRNSHILETEEP